MNAPVNFTVPAFDPKHEDVDILEAYEKARAHHAWSYSFDYLANSDPAAFERIHDEMTPKDEAAHAEELTVRDSWASTPAGVSAQLVLAIRDGGCDRWLDRGLFEQGIRAVYLQRKHLDGHDAMIIQAAFELLHIEFEQAVADWKRSEAIFNSVNKLRSDIDSIYFAARGAGDAPPELEALHQHADRVVGELSNMDMLDRLAKTLAPDWECYRRKAAIMLAAQYSEEAGPWLLRDVNFLLGEIKPEEVK